MTVIDSDLLQLAYPPRLDLGPQLTHEQLMSSMQATMGRHKGGPVWLFAYGSLIWRPECSSTERVRARVHGYHRGLYLWSHEHRGTPELPGLVFGLDRGGSCSGFAYRLPEDQLEASLYALWQREMPYPSYSDVVLNHVLQSACGRYGTTRDYVEQTVNALRSHAMPDKGLEARLKRCAKGCSGA
ncbi:calcium transporter ChaC [Pseudomonas fluorescens ABAC62]|nr:calcium transporter ChaC [Pseudomonas fluorescens ABAC62]